jgi:hypothetical protein
MELEPDDMPQIRRKPSFKVYAARRDGRAASWFVVQADTPEEAAKLVEDGVYGAGWRPVRVEPLTY